MAVKGLDLFREYFSGMGDQYVLIGGAASFLALEEENRRFRATRDLDIVLLQEAESKSFTAKLWEFVNAGGYEVKQRSDGTGPILFRFSKPNDQSFPSQLEFFSKLTEGVSLEEEATITPIPTDEGLTSLSAILLDVDYFDFLKTGMHDSDGLSFIRADRLIPFKARAWLDLTARREAGEAVDSKNITKHRNDVISLSELLAPEMATLPESISIDMHKFLDLLLHEDVDPTKLGATGDIAQVIAVIKAAFSLS